MDFYRTKGTLGRYIERLPWPGDFIKAADLPDFLSKIHILEDAWCYDQERFEADVWAAVDGELGFKLPGLDCASLVIGGDIPGYTMIKASVEVGDDTALSLRDIEVALRFEPEVLRPAPTQQHPVPAPYAQIEMTGSVRIDRNFDFDLEGFDSLSLAPVYIGDTGIIVSATGAKLDLSRTHSPPEILTAGFDDDFVGLFIGQAQVSFPPSLQGIIPAGVTLDSCAIGSGGVSGKVQASYGAPQFNSSSQTFVGPGAGEILGVPFALESIDIELRANALVKSELKGAMLLPFFEKPVAVLLSLGLDGSLSVGLASPDGLATLHIGSVLDLELDSLKFTVEDGSLKATLSGTILLTLPGLKCPPIPIENLEIDSKGRLNLPGGWLAMPKQFGLDFHSFKIEITKIGFGRTESGDKWFGLSGGIKLIDGLPLGVSVDGLRITSNSDWSATPNVTLTGVGVELDIKDVLYFKGAVAMRDLGGGAKRFDGAIRIELRTLKFKLDGQFVVGNLSTYRFMGLYLGLDMPMGMPVGSTGLAVYGGEALFTLRMEPNKTPAEPWYGIGAGQGWYKRNQIGVTDLMNKWDPTPGSKAFGFGLTFGTFPNSTLFNGRALLVAVFPGPIVLFEGAANIAKDRDKLSAEPLFRSLAVFDNRAGNLLVGLDVNYKYDASGKLIKLSAGTEAFYDFHDPMAWYLNLGLQTPTERRIQADVFNLFQANAYVMLSPRRFAMGAWVGYAKHWQFGPLKVGLEAWMESNVLVSFKPPQFYGDLALHGAVELSAFGFGLGLTVDARVEAEVFKPKHLLAELDVTLNLPAPLPKKHRRLTAHCQIEFGPEPDPPPIPVALKGVSVEHLKVSTTWPLPAAKALLAPVIDDGQGFLTTASGNIDALPALADIPVVPLDARPSLQFAHDMHDEAQAGAIVQIPDPEWKWIGDPEKQQGSARVRHALEAVFLDKWTGSGWSAVAGKGAGADGLPALFGSWTPAASSESSGVSQDRLLLWSRCGFDSYRNTGMEYGDWFAGNFGGPDGYPCVHAPASSVQCIDFTKLPLGPVDLPFEHPDHPGVFFDTPQPGGLMIHEYVDTSRTDALRTVRALCAVTSGAIDIHFADPAAEAVTHTLGPIKPQVAATGASGEPLGVTVTQDPPGPFQFDRRSARIGPGLAADIAIRGTRVCLTALCGRFGPAAQAFTAAAAGLAHNQSAGALWSAAGDVLEPHTIYRLRVATRTDVDAFAYDAGFNVPRHAEQAAFFRTEGPPGLATLSVPLEPDNAVAETALDDLGLYVRQTVPPTVPPRGCPPVLPRPVYRADDKGVVFNEDYVDLMYRRAGRDLSLILYDRNNQPVRGRNSAVTVAANPWGVAEKLSLAGHETSWLAMIAANQCVPDVDETQIPLDLTLAAAAGILAPDMLYQARVMPSLLHEDFGHIASGTGRWQPHDLTPDGGASAWAIGQTSGSPPAAALVQTGLTGRTGTGNAVHGAVLGTAAVLAPDPAAPANESPALWDDCRIAVNMRTNSGSAIGLAFRWQSSQSFYLFAMDQTAGAGRTLYRVSGGVPAVLAHDGVLFSHGRDYAVVIEAIGGRIRVWVDDVPVFDVENPVPIPSGTIALHCSNAPTAAFSDVRVHDLSLRAKPVYAFSFTTSQFVDFVDHLHSHDDDGWNAPCTLPAADLAAARSHAVTTVDAPASDAESRAYQALADNLLGTRARQDPVRTETYRIADAAGDTIGVLLLSPEPIDPARIALSLSRAPDTTPVPVAPRAVKLIAAALNADLADDETVTLLLRDTADLSGWRLQLRDAASSDPTRLDDPAPGWSTIHQFGAEEALPEGIQLVLHSGPPPASSADVPRVTHRYRAPAGDPGSTILTGDAVDLRLVNRDGEIEHARRFVEAARYAALGFVALRKADNTGIALLASDPSHPFPAGTLKLALEYRRDNRAHVPDSLILTRGGDASPETAEIHIPSRAPTDP